jgi:CDP-diacylglycerol--inositol 3-phosphatidyltransferase
MNSYKTPLGLAAYLLAYLAPYPHLVTAVPWLWKLLAQLTWPEVIALVTFPVCAAKQGINCVQFWKASKALTESDQEERWIKQNEIKKKLK